MPRALIDTTVLFAAAYRRDEAHDTALAILRSIDNGTVPEVVVLDYILAETLNGLTTHVGHDRAVDFLDRIETNARFHVDSLTSDGHTTAKEVFRQYEGLSFVDAAVVTYARSADVEYLYTFDGDFDAVDGIVRLDAATNPYAPD